MTREARTLPIASVDTPARSSRPKASGVQQRVPLDGIADVLQQQGARIPLWPKGGSDSQQRYAPAASDSGGLVIGHEAAFKEKRPKGRTRVGVGEAVFFFGAIANAFAIGDWKVGGGVARPYESGMWWTAPSRSASVPIELTVGSGRAAVTMQVVEPACIEIVKEGPDDTYPDGVQGAGMYLRFVLQPLDVCFGNVQTRELECEASDKRGVFLELEKVNKDALMHKPRGEPPGVAAKSSEFTGHDESNMGTSPDHAACEYLYSKYWRYGFYQWDIPNEFRVAGPGGGDGKRFTEVQQWAMIEGPPNAGRTTVYKGGQRTAARRPRPVASSG